MCVCNCHVVFVSYITHKNILSININIEFNKPVNTDSFVSNNVFILSILQGTFIPNCLSLEAVED